MTTLTNNRSWIERLLLAFARRPLRVELRRRFGPQPNDRDTAEDFCMDRILPALKSGREVILDFTETGLVTQSFVHALISQAVKEDTRWAARITAIKASKPQLAVFDLALRHMISPAVNKARIPVDPGAKVADA